jgi:hypothetical protein
MPTLKQIQLAKLVSENGGKRPDTQLMEQAGYSPATARTKQRIIQQGIGFVELLEQAGCSNKVIAARLKAGINAMNGKKADLMMRHRYLETTMKAKGLLVSVDSDPISGLADFIEGLKGFKLSVLIAIKQELSTEPTDVTS